MTAAVATPLPPTAARDRHRESEPLAPHAALAPGYTVVEHLDRGRLLDVYEVWSADRDCRCIAKALIPERRHERRGRARLLREGRLLQRFTHPHIVRGYETLEGPQPLVIMELLSGATLEHLIDHAPRRLSWDALVYLGLHLCSAMHYMHGQGYLHLDLKPANVVVGDDGRVRVIDLSLARRPQRSRGGMGTRPYMPPEQAAGGHLGPAADVWGIGAVLFEAATGRQPFPDDGSEYPQLQRRADPVRRHRRLPSLLAGAIDGCLEPDVSQRSTLCELAGALKRLEPA